MTVLNVRRGLDAGLQDYAITWQAMRDFTDTRDAKTIDELWWLEHPPVLTLGQAGKPEHILGAGDIPVVRTDRGGQVTYHGPGQLVGYLLFDLRRLGFGVRDLVSAIEGAIIDLLLDYSVVAVARRDAPGVYVDGRKVAALGLRIRKGCSYHGLSLNVDMDLTPFKCINPCGHQGLEICRTQDLGIKADIGTLADQLTSHLSARFGYDSSCTTGMVQPGRQAVQTLLT
ncbi:MAG: lipoyl(octanoyl) transferase LipB [SAR86 cluster bacterium]|jgi:lipoyl(octanoyl) transferase|tara:strand:+ start:4562 stop:5245 length:684 start_codon:yes stop_codon:yes gene_type:complete